MQHIETIELGSSQSSITFSSIPQNYDDLVIVLSARSDRANSYTGPLEIQPNASTSNLSSIRLRGSGSSVESNSYSAIYTHATASNSTSNTFASCSIYISNYTASQAKVMSIDAVLESNQTVSDQYLYAGLWDDTTAITSIKLQPFDAFNLTSGTTASLYGITAGGDGTVTTS